MRRATISNDELQLRILAELEEAGQGELVSLLNTVIDETQGRPAEVAVFRDAVDQLISKGLILMAPENEPGQRLVEVDAAQSRAMVSEVLGSLFFGVDDLHWTADPFVYSYAVLTETGTAASEKVLDDRGYRWWYHEENDDEVA
ncbi:hypothetical protein [Hyphomicrobium sp.]|uniref:hypothetical protein n=1 Tax=Hyphomicrobium sp. TaxID=82 RepID=UPI003F716F07